MLKKTTLLIAGKLSATKVGLNVSAVIEYSTDYIDQTEENPTAKNRLSRWNCMLIRSA
jgi:hypothetical protein